MQVYEASAGELTTGELPAFSIEKKMLVHVGNVLLSVRSKVVQGGTTHITAVADRGESSRFLLCLSVPNSTPVTTTFVDYDVERIDQ